MRTALFLLLLPACMVGGGDQTWTFDSASGAFVELANGSAEILSTTDDAITVEWSGGGFGDGARPQVECSESGLVTVDADGGLFSGGDFVIWVPEGVGAAARVDRGSVYVDLAAPSDLFACVGAGEVDISLPGGAYDLNLASGVGDLSVSGVEDDPRAATRIEACVGAGSLTVTGW